MATTFIGALHIFAGNFAPRGYAFCHGQLLEIAQNSALFALLGTTYGGNGQTNFALPDLRGRIPIGQGTGPGLTSRTVGEALGSESVTLVSNQMPIHNHIALANASPGNATPGNAFWAASTGTQAYGAGTATLMNPASVGASGGSQAHENRMPILAVNFIIALEGIFPSRN
jgi:microcystin-dependent protein